jgi:hypothetical protein
MIEQLDAVAIQERQKIRVQAGLRLGALLATEVSRIFRTFAQATAAPGWLTWL